MKIESFVYSILIFFIFIIKPDKFEGINEFYNLFLTFLYFLILFFFLWRRRMETSNWLRLDSVFLIGFTIVHIQVPFLLSLNIEPALADFIFINKDVVNYATWLSVLAICFWMLGYSLFRKISYERYSRNEISFKINFYIYDSFLLIIFSLFLSTVGPEFIRGIYKTSAWGGGAAYFYLILSTMLYLRIIYLFKDIPEKSNIFTVLSFFYSNKIFSIILVLYCILFISTGSRGEIIRIVFALGAAYSIFIKPVKFKVVVFLFTLGVLASILLSAGRGVHHPSFESSNIITRGYNSLKLNENKKGITGELASSVRILYRALDTVPEKHPYLYGQTYIIGVTSVVPFLTGIYVKAFDVSPQYTSSAMFFTYLGQGRFYTFGEGSEILADIYINFGLYPVFFLMFLFGFYISFVNNKASNKNFNYILIYTVLLMSLLTINRSDFLMPLYGVFYIFIVHMLFYRKKQEVAYEK